MNDKRIVLTQILDTDGLENSVEPVMLIDLTPAQAILRIEEHIKFFSQKQTQDKESQEQERNKRIADLLHKKRQSNRNKRGPSIG